MTRLKRIAPTITKIRSESQLELIVKKPMILVFLAIPDVMRPMAKIKPTKKLKRVSRISLI